MNCIKPLCHSARDQSGTSCSTRAVRLWDCSYSGDSGVGASGGKAGMKRPLVLLALLYVGGVLLANFVSCPPALLLATAFVLLLAALAWARARPLLLWPLLLAVGWTNFTLRTAILSPNDLRKMFS